MKRLLDYLPLHFAVLLIVGIVTQFYTQFWLFGFYKLLVIILSISCFLVIINNRKITTIGSLLVFFFIGVSAVYFTNDVHYKNYYKQYLHDSSSVIFKVSKVLKSGNFYDKYQVEIIQVDSIKTRGRVLLNIHKDSLQKRLQMDEKIYAKPTFRELIPPLNPHQFNYKSYLAKQGIYQQLFIANHEYKRLGFAKFSLKGISAKFRKKVQESLKKYHFKDNELAVINALLLGQRQDISKELISDYSRAGAIHILAVSGLHVGIILLILSSIFRPLETLKKGKILKAMLIVVFLWMFAFIAGLSASVVRAVTMFTFLAVGQSFKQKSVVEFSLISSLFFLLLVKPMFLFDVGFQLSYLAVFGIVWVQPKLYKIWAPKFKITDKFWQLVTASIAAQVGILPLSLYYFHQFPGLFILSNLVIIPFLGTILFVGIIIIVLSIFKILPQFFADGYATIISFMNSFVNWISNQEQFLLKEISMSFLKMFFLYIVIIFGVRFLIKKSTKRFLYFLCTIVVLQFVFLFEKFERTTKQEFIVFHKSRKPVLGKRMGNELFIYHNLDSLNIQQTNIMLSYSVGENILPTYKTKFKNIFNFKNKAILLVDSLGVYQVENLEKPIVVLQYSPKINLKRMIKKLQPSKIVADGSNYKSYINRWKNVCEIEQIPFHYTGQNGAFILRDTHPKKQQHYIF